MNKKSLGRKGSAYKRSARGQGIVEGVAGMVMLSMVGVMLIAMLVNCYAQIIHSSKAQIVAQLAANAIEKDRYWLGVMQRDDYDQDKATDNARQLADALSEQFGLPPIRTFEVTEAPGGGGVIQRVRVQFSGLRVPFVAGGVFPSTVSVEGIGCTAQVPNKAYAIMNISCAKPNEPNRQEVATIPVLSFGIGTGSNTLSNGQVNPMGYASHQNFPGNGSGTFGAGGAMPRGATYYRGLPLILPNTPLENQPSFHPYVVENLNGTAVGRFLN